MRLLKLLAFLFLLLDVIAAGILAGYVYPYTDMWRPRNNFVAAFELVTGLPILFLLWRAERKLKKQGKPPKHSDS